MCPKRSRDTSGSRPISLKTFFLQGSVVDTDGAAAYFIVIEHQSSCWPRALPGSISNIGKIFTIGEVNRWWLGSQRFSSVFHTHKGKSITQQKASTLGSATQALRQVDTQSAPRDLEYTAG